MSERTDLTAALNALDPSRALEGEQLSRYYVDRPRNPFPKMVFSFRSSSSSKCKILFGGFRGSGKTTELSRLSLTLQDDFFVVYFHAVHSLDLFAIDYVQIIFALALQVYKSAIEKGLKLNPRLVEEISDLVTIVSVEEEKKRDGEIAAGVEFNAQIAKLTGTLGVARGRAQTVTRQLEPRFSELVERLNSLLAEVEKKSGKQVLIIVEDLDKTDYDTQRDLFLRYGEALYSPNCHMVYVVTPPLLYEQSASAPRYSVSDRYLLADFPIVRRNGEPDQEGIQLLRKVIVNRTGNELFSKEALDNIVVNSGGNVRELLVLARDSVLEAVAEGAQRVERQHTERSVTSLRNNLSFFLDQQDLELLETLIRTGQIPMSEAGIRLLYGFAILQLQDDIGMWNVVHPCLEPLIRQRFSERDDKSITRS